MVDINLYKNETYDVPMVYDKLDLLVQEIDVLFSSDGYSVLACKEGWANLKQYIFQTKINATLLQDKIKTAIYDMCPTATEFNIDIQVGFIRGTVMYIATIDVIIIDENVKKHIKNYTIR